MYVHRVLGLSKRDEKIESNLYIELCSACGRQGKTEWRCSLSWFKSRGFMQGGEGGFYLLHNHDLTYPQAYSLALWWAKQLGIPFIKSHGGDEVLIWVQGKRRTVKQIKFLEKLLQVKGQRDIDKLKARIEQDG